MSSSSDQGPLRSAVATSATGVVMPELRPGRWTRLGDRAVAGDEVTEGLLEQLAEQTRDAARAQGYATGWAEGRRRGEDAVRQAAEADAVRAATEQLRRDAEHAATLAALEQAATRLRGLVEEVCRRVDGQAATLALELTRELVGGAAPDAAEHTVERVAGVLPPGDVARVRLHPATVAAAGALRERGVAVVADPDLGPADAVVEADDHVVDLRVDTALERLREVLS